MNIDRVRVKGLFDHFDHDLAFSPSERIMLVLGPNGFGKTTTLRLIDALFNQSMGRLARMPFRAVEVSFDDGTILTATRDRRGHGHDHDSLPLSVTRQPGGDGEAFRPRKANPNHLRMPMSAIEDVVPILSQIGPRRWQHSETGAVLDLEDVLAIFWDELPPEARRGSMGHPEWLRKIQGSVTVRFIDTERLTGPKRFTGSLPRRRYGLEPSPQRTVSLYSKELANLISRSIAEYGALSQSLDRTFPRRVVGEGQHASASVETLKEDLDAIEKRLSQLEDAGLLAGAQPGIEIPNLALVDDAQRGMLAVYAQDAQRKLEVFDDLYDRVSTFKRITNSRFQHKQVAVSSEGLQVSRDDGRNLNLEKLSSGEQHELIMLYEFLFRASANSLILIDEPEISLHVAWQEQWINDLEETAQLSGFRAIIATHSPEIIGERWSLTVELNGPSGR